MEFPKSRNGWSAPGLAAAHSISGEGQWLHKRRFGAVARNKGGALEVTVEQKAPLLDSYYSLGTVDGKLHVVGSPTARGQFVDRGEFTASSGFADYSANALSYYGLGRGAAPTTKRVGTIVDFNGKASQTDEIRLFTTRDGRKFDQAYTTYWSSPFASSTNPYNAPLSRRAYSTISGAPDALSSRALSLGLVQLVQGQYRHVFICDDGQQPKIVEAVTMPYQLAFGFTAFTTGPTQRFAAATYIRPEYRQDDVPHPVDRKATPGVVFQFSDDRGDTWTVASSASLIMKEFIDTVVGLPDNMFAAIAFNEAMRWFTLSVAPISANLAIIYIVVPYADPDGPDSWKIKAKVKLGLINHAMRTVTETAVLFDGDAMAAFWYASGGITPVEGGAICVIKPPSKPDYRDDAVQLRFTPDGVSMTTSPPLPQPAWLVGNVTSLSPRRLVCSMFDGAYSLFHSDDRGNTWAKRAVLSSKAAAPVKSTSANYLIDFGSLTQIRHQDAPANATPGAPWITDSRRKAPIL